MKLKSLLFILMFSGRLYAEMAQPILVETKGAVPCEKLDVAPEIQGKAIDNLKDFESKTLVARKIFHTVDDLESKSRIYFETLVLQNQQKVKVHCLSGQFTPGKRYSALVPLLIDVNSKSKIGNAFWQLQIFRNSTGLYTWNHRSLENPVAALDFLKTEFTDVQLREIQEDLIQLELTRQFKNQKQTLIIEYDVIQP